MKFKLILLLLGLVVLGSVPAMAQVDYGAPDTLAMEVTISPDAANSQFDISLDLFIWHDENIVSGVQVGFIWDNPNVLMDSYTPGSLIVSKWPYLFVLEGGGDLDLTNELRRFTFIATGLFTANVDPSPDRQLVCTFDFHAETWDVQDAVIFDTLSWDPGNKMIFIEPNSEAYVPVWPGPVVVHDVNYVQCDPPVITCPDAPADVFLCDPGEVCIDLPITGYDNVTAGDATWANDQLCFTANNSGTYNFQVVASVECGESATCNVQVNVEIGSDPVITCPAEPLSEFLCEGGQVCVDLPIADYDAVNLVGPGNPTWDNGQLCFTANTTDQYVIDVQATNTCGQVSCTVYINVEIGQQVAIECPTEQFDVQLEAAGQVCVPLVINNADEVTVAGATWADGQLCFDATEPSLYNFKVTATNACGTDICDVAVQVAIIPPMGLNVVPDTLVFTVSEGDLAFSPQTFLVEETDQGNISFTASSLSPLVVLEADSVGTTPANVTVNVAALDVEVGTYVDSIEVSSPEADNSPIYEYVKLIVKPCPTLTISSEGASIDATAGEPVTFSVDDLVLSSTGPDEIDWTYTADESFTVSSETSTTPSTVSVSYGNTFAEPGEYTACVTFSNVEVQDNTCQSSVTYCLTITVTEAPCVEVMLSDSVLEFTAIEGGESPTPLSRTLNVTSSDPEMSFNFSVKSPIDVDWVLFDGSNAEYNGTTPAEVPISVNVVDLPEGMYEAECIVSSTDDVVCDPKLKTFKVRLQVYPPPSADTVVVGTEPAVPGMQVMVPVTFANSCNLYGATAELAWSSGNIHLDSVSYDGSALADFDLSSSIDNDAYSVILTATNNGATPIAPGSGQQWASLYFSVSCDAAAGTYSIVNHNYNVNLEFSRDCGSGMETEAPEFVPGAIVVDTSANYVCGWVVEPDGFGGFKEVPGATVQLWADFPYGDPMAETMSSGIGSFAFTDFTTVPFDLYAYKAGYYPGKVENLNFGDKGVQIVLYPLAALIPTDQWVDYYCETNTYMGAPLPVGSIVEAYDPDGVLCGQQMVDEPGKYRFMPVYRDSTGSVADEGATTGDILTFYVNGEAAMASGDVTYPAQYEQVEVCLAAGETITKTCDLMEGWNLVSWNINTESDFITDVLGPYMDCIDVVLGFEQGGLTYDPDLTQFSTLWNVDHTSGYWIKVKEGCQVSLELSGIPVQSNTPIPVTMGWNLVSYLPDFNLTPDEALQTVMSSLLIAYGFDEGIMIYQPGQSQYNTLTEMGPCFGYWLKVDEDGELIYPGEGPEVLVASINPTQGALARRGAEDVTPTTSWVNLYASNLTLDGESVHAGALVEAVSSTGTKVGGYIMNESGKFGFMPVYADDARNQGVGGLKQGDSFTLLIDGIETNEPIIWTTNGDRVEVGPLTSKNASDPTLPDQYSLSQNYPNPFNPSTNINFNLPTACQARIEVYNVLGKLVAVPFDGMASSGENVVVWDGRDTNGETVASGIYLYRLTTDRFTETKKMMLVK